ncbi:MAG: metallophosphoesterase [Gemmataceae bacterium]|nr:metallophosphoesterase [Gemmataceae bacterium]
MRRLLVGLGAAAALLLAVAASGPPARKARPEFDFKSVGKDPATRLDLNNDPGTFRFAIVSDRTGGHRARVFAEAVDKLNLLQLEFVMSVGDLIEGYTEDRDRIASEWREFQAHVGRLRMPFFYVPGNHDLTNKRMLEEWRGRFGRTRYEFMYKGASFIVLDSEDEPGKQAGSIGKEQLAWLEKTLEARKGAAWAFVFLHKPMWVMREAEKSGWPEAEKLLAGRRCTVFAGHVHRYQKFVRQGVSMYMLSTTGGASRMRGVGYGEFDHIAWVTMRKDGPVVANILLDGVLKEDLSPLVGAEEAAPDHWRRPTRPVAVRVTLDGAPLPGAEVVFQGQGKEPRQPYASGVTGKDGRVRLSTYAAFDGLPAGDYKATVTLRKPRWTPEGADGPNSLPERYATMAGTPLAATVKANGEARIDLELKGEKP